MKTKRIFLIGYMGTGKSTLGRHLAKSLKIDFYDLDHYIESRFQKTISQIFDQEGEERFRKIEMNMLQEVGEFENVVIATGGGTPCFYNNLDYMNNSGITVYLKTSPEELTNRLKGCINKRPLIMNKTEEELLGYVSENLTLRETYYSQAKIIFEIDFLTDKCFLDKYVQSLIKLL